MPKNARKIEINKAIVFNKENDKRVQGVKESRVQG